MTKLVFLDAFPHHAAAGGDSIESLSPVSAPGFSDPMTYARVRDFLRRYRFGGWSPALEADLRANALGPELTHRQAPTGGYVADARGAPPDPARIAPPALQACAVPSVASEYPWLRHDTSQHARAATYVRDVLRPFTRRLCARFPQIVPGGRTVDVVRSRDAFFTRPDTVTRLIRRFLSE